jgi:hypothetical protein
MVTDAGRAGVRSVTGGKRAGDGSPPAIAFGSEPSAFMPAVDLLGLRAYGRIDGFVRSSAADFYKRWGGIPSDKREQSDDNDLVLLLQEKSDNAEVRKKAHGKLDEQASKLDELSSEGAEAYRSRLPVAKERVNKMIQSSGRSADQLIDELLSDIERFREDTASHDQRWREAARHVCEAIAAGRLEAWGRKGKYREGSNGRGVIKDAIRSPIPAADVDPDFITIVLDTSKPHARECWLTTPPDASIIEAQKQGRNEWATVSFKRDEAEAWLAAIRGATDNAAEAAPTAAPTAPAAHSRSSRACALGLNPRGRPGDKRRAAVAEMLRRVETGEISADALGKLKQKELPASSQTWAARPCYTPHAKTRLGELPRNSENKRETRISERRQSAPAF